MCKKISIDLGKCKGQQKMIRNIIGDGENVEEMKRTGTIKLHHNDLGKLLCCLYILEREKNDKIARRLANRIKFEMKKEGLPV